MKTTFFALFICLIFSQSIHARIIESIAAIVNEEIITLSDIKKYQKRLRSKAMVDDLLVNPQNIKSLLKNRDELINVLINEKILTSEVKKQGLEVTVERVEKEIRNISGRNGISRDQLVTALKAQGVNFSDYQNFIKTRIERQSLVERTITSRIKITDEEISAFYVSKNGKSGSQIKEATVAHIFVKKDPENPEKPLNKIKLVQEKIKGGDSFESIASQYSEDENFTQGGILGTFRTGDLVGDMEKTVQELQPGEISKAVETRRGFHILKIVKQTLVADPALNQEKNRIRSVLYQRAFEKQFKFWMEKKRREAFIRINKS